jgi:flagella basal body P-ring formation protein FlgA
MMTSLISILAAAFAAVAVFASEPANADVLPVPAVTIYPGDIVADGMLADRQYPDGTAARYPVVAAREEIVGKVARRTLLPGKAIPNNSVAEPDLVTRGAMTRAIYEDGALAMETVVLPLQNGALGALIQVRNVDSGKVIVGVVEADGTIRIGGK